jgi:dephospho-CoA kinase
VVSTICHLDFVVPCPQSNISNDKLQLARLLARPADPPLTPQQAQARMNAQMPVSSKLARATTVLDNSGTLADLESQLDRVVAKWRAAQGGESGWWWRLCWLVPPVGLAAGLICLLARWARARKPRRRTRGEGDEAFEMKPLRRP